MGVPRATPRPAIPLHQPAAGIPHPAEEDCSARQALITAAARFAFSVTPRLDAELLMAHALGIERSALLVDLDRAAPAGFAALVARRERHEPIAYITGTRGFWTIDLHVAPGVLVPRADSETLIEAAIDHFGDRSPRTILDLGTGSGALLLAALDHWPDATGIGIDRSDAALAIAAGNARRLGMQHRARFVRGDWTGFGGPHDLILCNPPYIATDERLPVEVAGFEPSGALFAGADGLDDYRALAPVLRPQLASGGAAILEIGATQGEAVTALLEREGFVVGLRHDLGGRPRALVAT